ncbi:hypothetical protein NESM_000346500 [Novymonas esmeraldas]|uniref:Uncharacterized protein n=1 Tax=Novymonas esmeraldas TaxID=1808958 RepID=A0AAW0EN25_9TRYP
MLTRRQARLLGLTSGEDSAAGGANAAATSPPPPLATRIHGDAVPQRHGSPVAGSAASSPVHHGALPVSAAGTEGSVSAGAGGGGSTTLLLSGVAAFLHAQGTRTGSSSRGRLGARQAEAMLASAQAVVDRWAAAGTTAGPSIRPASDAVRQARGQHVTHTRLSPSTAGASSDRSSAASSSAEVHASGRPARLTAAQLRTRWRGVMRSCTSLQPSTRAAVGGGAAASDVTSGSPHTLQLLLTARPASPPPSASRGEGPSASSDDGALHTGVAVHDTPHTHPLLLEQVPGRGLGTVTLTPCFDAATRRAPVTALALRKRRDGIRAQRQERLSHEVHHQTYVKAHEARLRLLFGVGAVERSGGEEGHDAVVAGEAAYLQSLDSRRSDEEARVLRVIASIDAMLRQQLTSAYHRQQPETGGAPARELGGGGGAARTLPSLLAGRP